MFTGIVQELGQAVAVDFDAGGIRLVVAAPGTAARTAVGDSVAIDGCCLTAVEVVDERIVFDAVPETLSRTTLGRVRAGAAVNVEPALRAGEPLGGHIVQGHVDGVGRVRSVEPEGEGVRLRLEVPDGVLRYCVEKGSLTVSGVSLTVAALEDDGLAIALIPHTLEATTLGALGPGDEVNLEADVLAKYVERLLARWEVEPLYRLSFAYPESWDAGGERFLMAEGRCEGRVAGRFRASNRARRRPDRSWLPHLHGAIETDDGASILLTLTGYGDPRAEPSGRVVASIVHTADHEYEWLNSTLGIASGEVRGGREVVLDVAELVWEPLEP